MNAFIGLLKKEFRLSRQSVFINLSILAFVILIVFLNVNLLMRGIDQSSIAKFVFTLMILVFQILYLAFFMLRSLRKEGKQLHLWLHNPHPAIQLLLAKLLNGILALFLSILISYLASVYFASKIGFSTGLIPLSFILVGALFATSIYLAIWVIFLWTLYQVLKNLIGKISIPVVIGIWIGSSWLLQLFSQTQIYQYLTDWGKLDISKIMSFLTSLASHSPNFDLQFKPLYIHIGDYLFHALLILVLLFLSSWFLDKKVEV